MTVNYYEDQDDSATTGHYAQLDVPTFDLANPPKNDGDVTFPVTPATGNSFIRLGVSPVTISYSNGSFSMSTDGSAPTGFPASLTLAKLVGNMDSSNSADTIASKEGTSDTALGSGYYTSDPYKGDSLLGFVDDTRVRDDASSSVLYMQGGNQKNSEENRRTESYRLLSKGGWWDHSDGNRISTTTGDKIEVIQGNYKLVVLGRRDPSTARTDTTDRKVTDISGGYEFSKKYEYLSTDQVWASWEKSSEINATKVTSGKEISYFKGNERRTYIGSHPDGTEDRPVVVSETRAQSNTSKTWVGANSSETHADSIEAKTWAKTSETYTGSFDDPVMHSLALTVVDFMEDIRFGITMQDARVFAQHTTVRTAGVLLIACNIAPITWKIDISPITFNTTMGDGFHISTKKTNIHLQKVQVAPKVDKVALMETKLTAMEAQITQNSTAISNVKYNLSSTVFDLKNQGIHVAAMHFIT